MIRDDLQKAIYDALIDADFGANDPAVYDYVPTNEAYPFIAIGDVDLRNWQNDDENNYTGEARIWCYSSDTSRRQVNDMLDVIEATLDRAELNLDNGHVVSIDRIFSTTDVEIDGADNQVRSGRIDFALLIGAEYGS